MEGWQLTLIILCSILVGALIPLLITIMSTISTVKKQIESTGKRVDLALDEAQKTISRVARLSSGLEGGEKQLAEIKDAIGDLTEHLNKVNSGIKMAATVGAAAGPVAATFMSSFVEQMGKKDLPDSSEEAKDCK